MNFAYPLASSADWKLDPANLSLLPDEPDQLNALGLWRVLDCVPDDLTAYLDFAERHGADVPTIVSTLNCQESDYPSVYLMVNFPSREFYVGASRQTFRRWKGHVGMLRHGKHHSPRANELALQHGLDSFRFIILQSFSDKVQQTKLLRIEEQTIAKLNPPLNVCRKDLIGTGGRR